MRKLLIALAATSIWAGGCGGDDASSTLKVGFIYDGATSDIGWSYQLDQGRLAIEAAFPQVRTLKVTEHVTSDNMGTVVDDMVAEGVRLIFGPGCCYTEAIKAFLAKHPDLYFENVNDTPYASNMSSFYASSAEFVGHRWLR
jgi:simple sugar transport system substrate-binding protein